jgi:hypothetical protein
MPFRSARRASQVQCPEAASLLRKVQNTGTAAALDPPICTFRDGDRRMAWPRRCGRSARARCLCGPDITFRPGVPVLASLVSCSRWSLSACAVPARVDASSGQQIRHRLNRGGDRQAGSALGRTGIVGHVSRPRAPGSTSRAAPATGRPAKEIIRCLKRYVAREVYKARVTPARSARPTPSTTQTRSFGLRS